MSKPLSETEEKMVRQLAALALRADSDAINELKGFLARSSGDFRMQWFGINRMAVRALLQIGPRGVSVLSGMTLGPLSDESAIPVILEALWHASHGRNLPKGLLDDLELVYPLDAPLPTETIQVAKEAFQQTIEESQLEAGRFEMLIACLFQVVLSSYVRANDLSPEQRSAVTESVSCLVFEMFTEPAIKITHSLISRFEALVADLVPEEAYQRFLAEHPVFIDPLASQVIPKQKLGVEHVTDYVVKRLDNEYVLVEIERPQDTIFTGADDFTAKFIHGYGQVLDFQQWVAAHGEYARTLMPGIVSPKGVLVIGMRNALSERQASKLARFCMNSRSIEIYTYDDLIKRATDLYENICFRRGSNFASR